MSVETGLSYLDVSRLIVRRLPLVLTLVSLFSASLACAGGAVEVVTNDDACLARHRLAEEIAARGARLDPRATIRLGVRVETTDKGVSIDVTGQSERGLLSRRHLEADSCADALTAVALIAALAVADDAAPVKAAAEPSEDDDAPALQPQPQRHELVYGSFAWAASSFARGQTGPRLAIGRSMRRTFLPWFEGAVSATLTRTLSGGDGQAALSWFTVREALAPLGMMLGARGVASLYCMLEAGVVVAVGSGATANVTRRLPWLAAGAGARVQWELGRWLLGAEAGMKAPFARDQLASANGGTVYRSPALGGEGAISLGIHFP